MNTINKIIAASLLGLLLMMGSVKAQDAVAVPEVETTAESGLVVGPRADMDVLNLQPVGACFVPYMGAFVVVDSVDNAIDLIVREGTEMRRAGRYTVDQYKGRHDVAHILHPKSVMVIGDKILFLASSVKDTSYLGVLGMEPQGDSLVCLQKVGFNCQAQAMSLCEPTHELMVVGKNPQGYDIKVLHMQDGPENVVAEKVESFHYLVPKQSDRIKESDPVGIGLTVVAVSVVFLALLCICLILKGYAGAIRNVQNRKAQKLSAKTTAEGGKTVAVAPADTAGDVYAAISAAIYLYNEELHDDEDTIITIQKVERAWTPWNAKFYNMNHYFNNRK